MEDQLLIIRKNDFLAQLSPTDYEMLNITSNFIAAEKDTYIYFDVQQQHRLYFVKEGFVKLGHIDDDGNELVKDILKQGDIFGQITLERGNASGEFARAHKQHAILCSFTVTDFRRLLSARPDLAIAFSRKVGQQLKKVENRILNLLQKDVRSRLLYFFWILADELTNVPKNEVTLENFFTHDDIARLTGTSRQTATTLINQFAEEGIVTVDRKNIVIHNKKLLQKLARVG
ncbi:MAG: Crp/Fnr family transcriptional regulator [Chitinophagia bacterium]|nr:Crp/Fnr family transcriptional regulator [Chitinophagia bacterium]